MRHCHAARSLASSAVARSCPGSSKVVPGKVGHSGLRFGKVLVGPAVYRLEKSAIPRWVARSGAGNALPTRRNPFVAATSYWKSRPFSPQARLSDCSVGCFQRDKSRPLRRNSAHARVWLDQILQGSPKMTGDWTLSFELCLAGCFLRQVRVADCPEQKAPRLRIDAAAG